MQCLQFIYCYNPLTSIAKYRAGIVQHNAKHEPKIQQKKLRSIDKAIRNESIGHSWSGS